MKNIENHHDFKPRNRRALWIFKLCEPFEYQSNFNEDVQCEWLNIKDGKITIPKDYAWDGCTFKISILDIWVFGVPDGIINIKTMKPKTYYASVIHDALYQYYSYHTISRKDIDLLFLKMMREANFKLATFYYLVVRLLGWIWTKKKRQDLEMFHRFMNA